MLAKPIILFVSDLDGTLLQADFTISPDDLAAIHRMEEAGILFAVATGRTHYDADMICKSHSLKPYIISNNGSCVFDSDGKLLFDNALDNKIVSELADYLEREEISYGLEESGCYIAPENWEEIFDKETVRLRANGNAISKEKSEFVKQETRTQHGIQSVKDVQTYLQQDPSIYSISVITYDQEKLQKISRWLSRYREIALCVSGTHNAEIMCASCTKGHSLDLLCEYLQIPLQCVAAAGDNLNDLNMITKAGFGIAIGNARKEVKEAADFVAKPNRENGIAEAIRYILDQT